MERLGSPGMKSGVDAPVLGDHDSATEPSPREQAREDLVSALSAAPGSDPLAAERMADEVLSTISGAELHLERVSPPTMRTIERFPAEGWDAIARHAAAGGLPINSVVLPLSKPVCESGPLLRALCEGVSALRNMTHLAVRLPDNGPVGLDLGALRSDALRTIEIHVPSRQDKLSEFRADVRVPDGVEVQAKGGIRPSVHKSFVTWVDSKGASVGEPRALAGATFYRQPFDVLPAHDGDMRKAAWGLISTNNNCDATFKDAPDKANRIRQATARRRNA